MRKSVYSCRILRIPLKVTPPMESFLYISLNFITVCAHQYFAFWESVVEVDLDSKQAMRKSLNSLSNIKNSVGSDTSNGIISLDFISFYNSLRTSAFRLLRITCWGRFGLQTSDAQTHTTIVQYGKFRQMWPLNWIKCHKISIVLITCWVRWHFVFRHRFPRSSWAQNRRWEKA